ncbi:MAG: hypothetical protein PHY64_04020 [Eubacteriales bacterium]|nr:hypothetical protein [Eubacteriales bacterium]
MLRRGMFVYPWDIGAEPEAFLRGYTDCNCNMIAVNASYHQCNVLDTRLKKVYERRQAGTSFAIHPEKYGRIKPHVVNDLTADCLRLRELCEKQNVDWRCWNVSLHNDQVGDAYPDTAVLNLWGSRYPSALCLNHPDVRVYARALLEDVLDTLAPSRVIVESDSWMQAFHGRHHEFALARLTPAVRYLLSLCFCPHCVKAAATAGIDAEEVRRTAALLLDQLLQGDTTFGANEDAQLTQLFLEYPSLYAYQRFRMDSVAALVKENTAAAHRKGVLYEAIPSAAPFMVNATYFEGAPLRALADIVDGFVPLCYSPGETYPLLLQNIRLYAPEGRVSVAFKLARAGCSGEAEFAGLAREAAQAGVEAVYCYNYGLATPECLGWMRRAYGNQPL